MGKIHSIQSLGTVDGPGVRFVVFFSGCNLRCGCCHNPDTWEMASGSEMTADEVATARAKPLADEDLDLLEEFKKAGEESYRTSLREYAQLFLTAWNVIAVSKGDIEDAALRVVAHKIGRAHV